jgi:hypothetical protein
VAPGSVADDTEGRSLGGRRCSFYVFYLVFSWNQPTNALYRLGASPVALFFRRLLMPPLLYVRVVFWVVITSKRPTFLLGRGYPRGVWFYFPVVFGSAGGPLLPAAYREIGGAPFDLRGLFNYANQHPEKLSEIMEWIRASFRSHNKPQTSPPPPPSER